MKAQDQKIIDYLNRVLKNELTAINQYFLHAKIMEDRGLKKLAEKEKRESIEEMEHADGLMERILFLEGLPNLQDLGRIMIGEDIEEMLDCDLQQEMIAVLLLREAVAFCESQSGGCCDNDDNNVNDTPATDGVYWESVNNKFDIHLFFGKEPQNKGSN